MVASQVVLEALSLRCLIQSQILATPQRFVTFVLFFVTQSSVTVVSYVKQA